MKLSCKALKRRFHQDDDAEVFFITGGKLISDALPFLARMIFSMIVPPFAPHGDFEIPAGLRRGNKGAV